MARSISISLLCWMSIIQTFYHFNHHVHVHEFGRKFENDHRLQPSYSVLSFPTASTKVTFRTRRHTSQIQNGREERRTFISLEMAKGDGKKNRKKQSESASSSSSSTPSPPPTPAAPRVSNNINIPIRRQIQYGRMNKQFRQSGATSFRQQKKTVRTKYRRTWDEEEIEQKAEERKRKGQDPDWAVVLNQTKAAPLVIVDGYNIIHKWPRLKKHMNKGDTGRARQLLVDDLENLRSLKGWRIEVVFDGAGKNFRSGPLGDTRQRLATAADRAATKDVSKHGVRTVFTGTGIEADSYIEARCAQAKNVTSGAKTGTFIVATDDAMIRLAGESAGALCMGSDRFVSELKAVKKATAHRVEVAMAKVNGHSIRPEKLWGTNVFGASSSLSSMSATPTTPSKPASDTGTNIGKANGGSKSDSKNITEISSSSSANTAPVKGALQVDEGKFVYRGRFGRGNLIIEDKRKKKRMD